MLKQIVKYFFCLQIICMWCLSFPTLQAEFQASKIQTQNQQTTKEKKKKDKQPLSSIDELLNEQQYLFLEGDRPAVDLRGATILIHADTGQVIYSEDSEVPLPIYSMTKILAAYVLLDAINASNAQLAWEQEIIVNEHFANISQNPDYSGIGFAAGEKYTVAELFDLSLVISDNTATMILAEAVAGNEQNFVELMKQKLIALNITKADIHTSSGLSGQDLINYGYQGINPADNLMSAQDMAFLTKSIVHAYPEILKITSKKEIVVGKLNGVEEKIAATNELLFADDRVKGFKTGSSLATWSSNLTFFAEKEKTKVIGVRIGAYDGHDRLEEAKEMVNFAFTKTFQHILLSPKSKLFNDLSEIKVTNGFKSVVKVQIKHDFIVTSSFDKLQPKYIFIPTNKKYNAQTKSFYAPIKKGEQLGVMTVVYRDLKFLSADNSQTFAVPVIAATDMQNGFYLFNWMQDIFREFLNIFQ